MTETIDETIKRWLRKWLEVPPDSFDMLMFRDDLVFKDVAVLNKTVPALEQRLTAALAEIENTRQDLIQRMDDLSREIAERKKPEAPADQGMEQISPGRVPFSVRRQRAQGTGTNMNAYIVPKKNQ